MTRIARAHAPPRPQPGVTLYSSPTDLEIATTRVLAASRQVVWAAISEPRHLAKWLLGPDDWTMTVCENDLRVGGVYRYAWRKPDGTEMSTTGEFREVLPPERLSLVVRSGPGEAGTSNTTELTEEGGATTLTMTVTYPSRAARDAASAATGGMDADFDRLDALLQSSLSGGGSR
jgi:uncharacterized protein YndB with AHSA1/START domain